MRIRDWSSDVCSSDLRRIKRSRTGLKAGHALSLLFTQDLFALLAAKSGQPFFFRLHSRSALFPCLLLYLLFFNRLGLDICLGCGRGLEYGLLFAIPDDAVFHPALHLISEGRGRDVQIGRASCRERVWRYVLYSVVAG